MSKFPNFLNCCLFLYLIVLDDAREIQFQHDSSMRLVNFVEHKSGYLEVTKLSETRVQKFADCAMECLTTPSCISLNMASSKDQSETFWCELLLDDMFNNSQKFKANITSRHFSKWVSLLQGDCFRWYDQQNFGIPVCNFPVLYEHSQNRSKCKYMENPTTDEFSVQLSDSPYLQAV